ncbi:ACT domain-containing protein [Candidatus Bathyarchaeota archaeon]|nr:ACT domain-containing protein [Candidatus Bathyarchaeota archaeon]
MSYIEKISIAEATRRVIWARPLLLDALKQNVVNYKALAELIAHDVEKLLADHTKISIDSIQAAIMRYSNDLKQEKSRLEEKIGRVIAGTVLELKNDLIVVTIKEEAFLKHREGIFTLVGDARFFHLIQGNSTFTIIADQGLEQKMLSTFTPEQVIQLTGDQSGLVLISPEEIIDIPGVASYLHSLLAHHSINITQALSCYKDTILIVDRREALQAYSLLEEQILRFRKLSRS